MTCLRDDDKVVAYVRERLAKAPKRHRGRELVRPASLWQWLPFGLIVIGILTVVQVGTAAIDHYTAPRINEGCTQHRDCGADEVCLMHLPLADRYCTRACAPGSCPAGMHCGDISTIPEADRGVGAAGPAAASSACIR